jgi:hypothetical protein
MAERMDEGMVYMKDDLKGRADIKGKTQAPIHISLGIRDQLAI